MKIIYRSKVSPWLICVIIGVSVIPMIPTMIYDFSWVSLIIVALILFVAIYSLFCIVYIIDGNALTVKCGIFSKTNYDISKITKIKRTNSILSAPASSLDRIAIYFLKQKTPIVISPKDKIEFIQHLQSINPNIIFTD